MPSPEFFLKYRDSLAANLLSTSDRQERRQILIDSKTTLEYQLAKNERIAFLKKTDFTSHSIEEQTKYQQNIDENFPFFNFYMSNENCLHKLFPTIKNKKETIVAVGSDQGLDLFVNSQAKYLLMVDICQNTSSLSRSLLELGSIHKKIFGQYPTVEQYHTYFKKENVFHIIRLLENNFEEIINEELTSMFSRTIEEPEPQYYEYLKYKSSLHNDNKKLFSWNSSDDNLKKVFEAYDQGRIFILQRDLYTKETAKTISEIIESKKSSIDVLYLSNSIDFITNKISAINTLKMPLNKKSIIITTEKKDEEDNILDEDYKRKNLSLYFFPWHYTAMSYEVYKKKVTKNNSLFGSVFEKLTTYSPEKGVTLAGINVRGYKSSL